MVKATWTKKVASELLDTNDKRSLSLRQKKIFLSFAMSHRHNRQKSWIKRRRRRHPIYFSNLYGKIKVKRKRYKVTSI